jgi:hypothetical protein
VTVILPEKSIYTGMIPVVVKIGHGSILISSSGKNQTKPEGDKES